MLKNHAAQTTYCTLSRGVSRNLEISAFLGEKVRLVHFAFQIKQTDIIVMWGKKHRRHENAVQIAKKKRITLLCLEDGFVCYAEAPSRGGKRYSFVRDDIGIYYDATKESRLEEVLNNCKKLDEAKNQRAEHIRSLILSSKISKYNHLPLGLPKSISDQMNNLTKPFVLVIDQTRNDCSITYGLATEQTFKKMLEDALSENPDSTILLKTHPETNLGLKQGHFNIKKLRKNKRIIIVNEDCNLHELLAKVNKVYVVTSQVGFEALLHNIPVHTYGMPFYAGWGLTEDKISILRRYKNISLNQLIISCFDKYCEFFDPTSIPYKPVPAEQAFVAISKKAEAA